MQDAAARDVSCMSRMAVSAIVMLSMNAQRAFVDS
jgi:hypothetical protein